MYGSMKYFSKNLPVPIQNFIRDNICSLIPWRYRFGREYWRLKNFFECAQWWDRVKILDWQLTQFKKIVAYAYEEVPGYHFLYSDAGITPKDIHSLEDVKLLPFTTKELFRDNLKDFVARKYPKRKLNYLATGGSTGTPFGFYATDLSLQAENVFIHLNWERTGWRAGRRMATLRGGFVGDARQVYKYDKLHDVLLLSSFYVTESTVNTYIQKLNEFEIEDIHSSPSTILQIANYLLSGRVKRKFTPKRILLASENLYPFQLEIIKSAFPGVRLFSHYGLTEQAVLASWCEKTNHYHVWPFYGYMELLDEQNREVCNGSIGEIVGTSFWNYGTPFIRYRTLDMATKGADCCADCGRNFPILTEIQGRKQECIITGAGRHLSMFLMAGNMHSDIFQHVQQFQFYQNKPGEVVLRVVRKETYSEKDQEKINKEMYRLLGDDVNFEIKYVDEISKTSVGKIKFLDQELEINAPVE